MPCAGNLRLQLQNLKVRQPVKLHRLNAKAPAIINKNKAIVIYRSITVAYYFQCSCATNILFVSLWWLTLKYTLFIQLLGEYLVSFLKLTFHLVFKVFYILCIVLWMNIYIWWSFSLLTKCGYFNKHNRAIESVLLF